MALGARKWMRTRQLFPTNHHTLGTSFPLALPSSIPGQHPKNPGCDIDFIYLPKVFRLTFHLPPQGKPITTGPAGGGTLQYGTMRIFFHLFAESHPDPGLVHRAYASKVSQADPELFSYFPITNCNPSG